MSNQSKNEYLAVVRERYRTCKTRKEKSALISEVVDNLSVVRKSAIRLLRKKLLRRKPIQGRVPQYGFDLIQPLKRIWEVAGCPCSKWLKPQMPDIIGKLKQFHEITLYDGQEEQLLTMSTFTIDKLLEAERDISRKEYGLSGTKRSSLLKTLIPVRTYFNQEELHHPGHAETD